ncbi:MAG: TetR/AcrR family transcriptional regulator [Pseudomonadota bacterium]
MARPMAFDRDTAIDSAMRLIWRDGYEASSVKSVSEALGITRSSYYNTFRSRDALYALALGRYFEVIPERTLFTDAAERDFPAVLTATLREVCRVRTTTFRGLGCMAANGMAELLPARSKAGDAVQRATDGFLARLTDLVKGSVERGELPADTGIETTAVAIHTLIVGLNLESKVVQDEAALWASARATLLGLGLYADGPPPDPSTASGDSP